MLEGLAASVVSSGLGTIAQWMGRKKDPLDEAQTKANATKLAAETLHLEELTAVQKQQLGLASRESLHQRIAWACSPYNEGCAKALQTFAQETGRTFVRLLALLAPGVRPTPQMDAIVDETVGAMLDAFGVALPYMQDSVRQKFSVFLTAAARCANLLRAESTKKPTAEDAQAVTTAYFELLPELRESVHPVYMYGVVRRAADKVNDSESEASTPKANGASSE